MESLKKLINYAPIGSAVIIFLSAFKLTIYFSSFNINIFSYLTLTEFIILFIRDAIKFLIVISLASFGFFILDYNEKFLKKIKGIKLEWFWKLLVFIIILVLLLALGFLMIKIMQQKKSGIEIATIIFSMTVLFSSMVLIYIAKSTKILFKSKLIFSSVLTIIILTTLSVYSVHSVKNGRVYLTYKLALGNEIINTDDNLIRIARTENFFFLYDKNKKESQILKNSDIKEIRIREIDFN